MIEFLKKQLFGQKVFKDSEIGKLEARIKSTNPSIPRTWTSSYLLKGQSSETTFIMEGNVNGPWENELISVYRIVKNLTEIMEEIDLELRKDQSKYEPLADWKKSLYLSAVVTDSEGFEISFESLNPKDFRYVGCLWKDGRVIEIA